MKHKAFNKGFTLIELLVVIAIIGLLSSVVFTSLNTARAKARDARRIEDLNQIRTALELFYDEYNRYPVTAGHQYWDGHWMEFQDCLEIGKECDAVLNSQIPNYQSVISEVPQDPLDPDPNSATQDVSYYYSWGGCGDQEYLLKARLETDNPVLDNDADGSHYPGWPNGCDDPYYCIKVNWCR